MKTVFACITDHQNLELPEQPYIATCWFDTRLELELYADSEAILAKGAEITLISFVVPDDADDDVINDILDDFVTGRTHLADIGAELVV